jgi:hypothetical protein
VSSCRGNFAGTALAMFQIDGGRRLVRTPRT